MILCLNYDEKKDDFSKDSIEKICKYLRPIKGPALTINKKIGNDIPDNFILLEAN